MARRNRRTKPRLKFKRRVSPGAPPGTLIADPAAPKPTIRVFSYGPDVCEEKTINDVAELKAIVGQRPVTWVNVDGLGDAEVIRKLGEIFALHPLALEDVLQTHQRPKVEQYGELLFIIAREVRLNDRLETEQFSMFLGHNFVLSFGERVGDCFDPIRERIRRKVGKLRDRGSDLLAYALLDSLVDSYFPVLENYGDRLETVEDSIVDHSNRSDLARLHEHKRDLLTLRRAMWPTREALAILAREEHPLISPDTRVFLRDCYDHVVQIIDIVETYREVCSDLMDVYLSAVSYRLNEVMKVLTIISTIFIPLTFLAGVYGMNFHTDAGPLNMPELHWRYGYVAFWAVSTAIAIGLLTLFKHLGWLGRRPDRQEESQQA